MHREYTDALDFVLDEYFRQWVRAPNSENSLYWSTFLEHHPEKSEVVAEARNWVNILKFKEVSTKEFDPKDGLIQIKNRVHSEISGNDRKTKCRKLQAYKSDLLLTIMVIVVLLILFGYTYLIISEIL